MRKVWVSQRNKEKSPGVYVEWLDENKRRRSKYFAPQYKRHVKPFMDRKFLELNSEIRPVGSAVNVFWHDLMEQDKQAQGAKEEQDSIESLEAQVADWVKSQQIRDYVNRVEERLRLSGAIEEGGKIAEQLAWARRYADSVDPLTRTLKSEERDPEGVHS